MKILNDENYNEIINNTSNLIIKFEAPWCQPCSFISPILEELSTENEGKVEIVKCNVDESPETAKLIGIRSIPTVMFFKHGVPQDKIVGATSKITYQNKINQLYE